MPRRAIRVRFVYFVSVLALVLTGLMLIQPVTTQAEVLYMTNVTEEMSDSSFWAEKLVEPNRVLASPDEISSLNQQILADKNTNMNDLKNWPQDRFDGVAYGQSLRQAARDDAEYFYTTCWARYDQTKRYYESWDEALEEFYTPIIDNCANEHATTEDELLYGICTKRGYIRCLPTDEMILDDPNDPDFDYLYQTALRVNEPVIIQGISNDGQYYHVISSCTMGWVDKDEIALCANREQWLDAWDIPDSEVLVVYDDKIQTEESNYAPQTSRVTLPMGTCLRLAAQDEWGNILSVTNRSGHNNHIVWMPVRNEDGTYAKQLALIPEHCKVSEGYLPLTANNILSVSLNYLGNAYGWGAMLGSEDCSGYVRDVYRCFGLDLPRNTTWQSAAPVQKYHLSGLSDEEKISVIKSLPPGATLYFSGHEMTYLGCENDKLYVISNISSVVLDDPQVTNRIRCCVINTLQDVKRRSGNTWLTSLSDATIPFYDAEHEPWSDGGTYLLTYGDNGSWKPGDGEGLSFVIERSENDEICFDHFTGISIDGVENNGSAYEAKRGSVELTLKPEYLATLTAGSHNVVAHFDDGDDVAATFDVEEADTFTVTTESTGNGTVYASQTDAVEGASITVTLTPDVDYTSSGITVTAADESTVEATMVNVNTYTFTMPASDVTVVGSFTAVPPVVERYTITTKKADHGYASAQKNAEAGTEITVTLTPRAGYVSQDVTVLGEDGTAIAAKRINENTYTFTMPEQNVTVQGQFAKADEPVTYTVTAKKASHGTVGTSVKEASEGDLVTITLEPNKGYKSKGVSVRTKKGKSVTAEKINENTYTFEMPAQDVNVSGTFSKVADSNTKKSSKSTTTKTKTTRTKTTKATSSTKSPSTGDPNIPPQVIALIAGVGVGLVGVALYLRKRSK